MTAITADFLSSFSFLLDGYSELRAQNNLTRNVTLSRGDVILNQRTEEKGVFARFWEKGAYGACSAPGFQRASVEDAISKARQNAKGLAAAKTGFRALPEVPALEKEPELLDFKDVEQREILDYALALDELMLKRYPGLSNRQTAIAVECVETALCSSFARNMERVLPRAHVFVTMTAKDGAGLPAVLTGRYGGGGSFCDHFRKPEGLLDKLDRLYQRLMDKGEGVFPEAGVADVILDASLAGILAHEAVGHTAESDLVRSGSIACVCRNQLVASEKVNLVDFAHSALDQRAPLPIHVDDEGTPASDVTLIRDGILLDYMTNLQDAPYIGALPKGNGRAFCYSDEPLVRMRNTCILPGQDNFDDMVASIDRGYYLAMNTNGQADSTSEFMFGVSMGYVIEKGKLGRALRDTTISGVAFDVLKTVSMVGNEIVWSASGNCGKKTRLGVAMGGPAIKCRLRIGGR